MITIVIDGIPVSWRAHAGYGRKSFNPRYREREYYQWQIRSQWNQQTPISAPIRLDVAFHLPIPKATSKVRRLQMLNDKIHHICRPDVDNLNKFLNDTLKGIVFEDDSQVVALNSRKIYGETPKTVVNLEIITCP